MKLTDLLSSTKILNKNGQTIEFPINLTVYDLL
nr:MAG TPA: adenylyltransferase [Caudoviricetes sp.]